MDHRRLSLSDIVIGEPLPWDIFDNSKKLLLRKGHIIERAQQIEALLARGLFVNSASQAAKNAVTAVSAREHPSALRIINQSIKRLERLFYSFATEPDFASKLLEIARLLRLAFKLNPDVALASVLLNQHVEMYSTRHCVDTALVATAVACHLKKPEVDILDIIAATLTMNIGMLNEQEKIQSKQGVLSDVDRHLIRSHPDVSVRLLQQAGVTNQAWLSNVAQHHENEDGTGYPHSLKGAHMAQNAKIIAIADRYCARISVRGDRKPLLPNAAIRGLLTADKDTIDRQLAATFIRELSVYPIGTLVRLENGEIGVVTSRGSSSTTPYVHALVGPRGEPLAFAIKRDTSRTLYVIRDVLSGAQAALRISMQQLWGEDAAL